MPVSDVKTCFCLSVGRSLREVYLETLRQAFKPAGTHDLTVLVNKNLRPNTLSAHGLRVDKDFLLLIPAQLDWKCNKPLHGDGHGRRPNTDTLVARRCCVTRVENRTTFFSATSQSASDNICQGKTILWQIQTLTLLGTVLHLPKELQEFTFIRYVKLTRKRPHEC